jgi:hypothetical protein
MNVRVCVPRAPQAAGRARVQPAGADSSAVHAGTRRTTAVPAPAAVHASGHVAAPVWGRGQTWRGIAIV